MLRRAYPPKRKSSLFRQISCHRRRLTNAMVCRNFTNFVPGRTIDLQRRRGQNQARFWALSRSSPRRDGWRVAYRVCDVSSKFLKYWTHVVLYLVGASVFAKLTIIWNRYWLYLNWSCITDGLDSRLFHVKCQQPLFRLVEFQKHTYLSPASLS